MVTVPVTAAEEYRVYCERCELEEVVTSLELAKDMVQGHTDEEYCTKADWEAVE